MPARAETGGDTTPQQGRSKFKPDAKLDPSQVQDVRGRGMPLGAYPEPTWMVATEDQPHWAAPAYPDGTYMNPWFNPQPTMAPPDLPPVISLAGNPRDEIIRKSKLHGVPVSLALSVAYVASGMDQTARSKDGAGGLFKLTQDDVGPIHDPAHWRDNIAGGITRLVALKQQHGSWAGAVTAHLGAAGAASVQRTVHDLQRGRLEIPKGDPGTMTLSAPLPIRPQFLSDYGPRKAGPGAGDFHTGIDIAAPAGTQVAALTGGRVTFAGEAPGAGNSCVIRDRSGREWAYAHMGAYHVKEGDRVQPGHVIGEVGSTGLSTGNHLHIGVRVKGVWANPLSIVQRAFGVEFGKTKRDIVSRFDFDAPAAGGVRVGGLNGQAPSPLNGAPSPSQAWQNIVDTGPVGPEMTALARKHGAVA